LEGKGNGPDWLMFQRDIRRQSNFCASITTDINEETVLTKDNFTIYPNPANSHINIDLKNKSNKALDINIYNSSGMIYKIKNPASETVNINTREWPTGIYMSVIKDENGIIDQKKFVIVD
jgi:hypothetical protein